MYFITGNIGKFNETKHYINDLEQLDIDLVEIQSLDPQKIIEHKLHEASKVYDGEFIVEDTCFYLECLNGLPGPYIKWFEKTVGLEGIYNIAKGFNNFNAKVVITFGYLDKSKSIHYFSTEKVGTVVFPRGTNGFGWDPIFVPDGHTKTHAEMSVDELKEVKLRGKVAKQVQEYLDKENSTT